MLVVLVPDHAPDAVQVSAPVAFHVSVVVPPAATVVGDAVSVTLGGGVLATVAVYSPYSAGVPPAFAMKLSV